jgi:glycosyltransferase involved in cell wall biosynthesis
VYNGEKWLAETIKSVTSQTLKDLVIIVSDNASVDNSWQIAQELAQSDERIQCQRNAVNLGVFRNLDRVFELSSTPYFKWCSVGDLLEKSFLGRAVNVLEKHTDVTLVYAKTKFIGSAVRHANLKDLDVPLDSPDTVSRYRSYLSAHGLNSPFHGLVRSQALSSTSLNKEFRGSDQCLIAALLLQGRFTRLPEELLYRRIEPDTATAIKAVEDLDDFFGAQAAKIRKHATWKVESQLFRDLIGATTEFGTKFRLMPYLFRRLYWQRRRLLRECGRNPGISQ